MHTISSRPPKPPYGQSFTQVTTWAGAARPTTGTRNYCSLSLFLNDDGTAHVIGHANLTGSYSVENADDRPHAVALSALVQGF